MQNQNGPSAAHDAYRKLRWSLDRHGFSAAAQEQTYKLLNGLKWPLPSSDAPLHGNSGALLFHPTVGIVCRIQHDAKIVEHPLILPRLRSFKLEGNCTLELCVGGSLHPAPCEAEANWICRKLMKDGIVWSDTKKYNVCHLPMRTEEHPDGLPVIMDREKLELMEGRHLQRRDYTDFGVPEIQSRIFREQVNSLRRLLARACLRDSMNPDSNLMDEFWQTAEALTTPLLAKKITVQKPLFQGWGMPDKYLLDSHKVEKAMHIFGSISPPPQKPGKKPKTNGPAPAPTAHHRPH